MSGICGLFNLDGAPVKETDIGSMCRFLEQRGPDGTGAWLDGPVGFGNTLLASTPESKFENQPFAHAETGCVITADIRLDNRDELAHTLQLRKPLGSTGDAELVLAAYLTWGEGCPNHLLGDFAFAVWDPRNRQLFCTRDHFGMRPLYYHHISSKHLVFASDARALLVLPQLPFSFNEGRIADFLVAELEWYDYTSSFFEDVYRLPPGHRLIASPDKFEVSEYYYPQPGPDLSFQTDDDYRQGFIEVFGKAVDARLRVPDSAVGSMLSGGMDSGSVVAAAKEILARNGLGPLATFSGAQRTDTGEPAAIDCAETRAILASSSMPAVAANLVHPDEVSGLYEQLSSGFEEPFDGVFTILKALSLKAHDLDMRVMLDGGGGDMVLHEGSYIVRMIRKLRWRLALREIVAESRYQGWRTPLPNLFRYARSALLPRSIKNRVHASRYRRRFQSYIEYSLISEEFADRMGVQDRIERMRKLFQATPRADYATEYCDRILPNMTAGKERYARIAASVGMEARDPFMDKRVIEYCSRLPGRFLLRDGWPKVILRDINVGVLPDEVLWTPRKPHLGWLFANELTGLAAERGDLDLDGLKDGLRAYIDEAALSQAWQAFQEHGDAGPINNAHILLIWLQDHAQRPVVPDKQIL